MKPIMAGEPQSQSADIIAENVAKLRSLFPEAFPEGAIDFAVLQQLLGGTVPEKEEKYGLNWHGKRAARQLALTPSMGTLRPAPEDSVGWDTTRNIMIEGDNLEVLKLLQKSYSGKVKLIYIDPPYNTGKDFVYKDDYHDSIGNYQRTVGLVDGNGHQLITNTDTSGRFHTNWLNMMFPRLQLARNLLREDGIIAVSVDDNEMSHLWDLMCVVFGEEQHLATVIIQSNKRGQTYKQIAKTHEYLVVFARNEDVELAELEKVADALPFQDSTGAFDLWELRNRNPKFGKFNRPNLYFPIYVLPESIDECGYSRISLTASGSNSIAVYPRNSEGEEGCWRWGQDKIRDTDLRATSPTLVAKRTRAGGWNIYEKSRKATTKAKSIWADTEMINEQGTIELGLFSMGDVFDHPKPTALLKRLLHLTTSEDDLIADFFAGSGTTGHAIMGQNAQDGGERQYILVQLPEPLDPAIADEKTAAEFCDKIKKPRTIAELTKERLRRAGKKVKADHPMFAGDTGFRVYKLDSSNIQPWDPKPDDLEGTMFDAVDHIKDGRTPDDILVELLLKLGLDLCVPIETKTIAKKNVHSIGGGVLIVCLEEKIATKQVEELALGIVEWHKALAPAGDSQAVFRDSAFEDDIAKTNLTAILAQHGLANVRSL